MSGSFPGGIAQGANGNYFLNDRSSYQVYEYEGTGGAAGSSGNSLNIRVESCPVTSPDCDGAPLSNATVEVYAVDNSTITPKATQTYNERAEELLDDAANVTPPAFDQGAQLVGDGGRFAGLNDEVPLVHTVEEWHRGNVQELFGIGIKEQFQPKKDPQLGSPNVVVPSGEPVMLSVWEFGRSPLIQDGVDGDIPGAVSSSGEIRIEQLAATNETISTRTVETEPVLKYGFVAGKTHEVAMARLPDGYYRATVVETGRSLTFAVGSPSSITSMIEKDLRNEADNLAKQARDIRQRVNDNTFSRTVTTSNSSGWANISVSQNTQVVGIQVYRMDGDTLPDLTDPSPSDLRDRIQATDYNASVYVAPTETVRLEGSSTNVTVQALEITRPMYGNLTDFADWWDWVQEEIGKADYMGLAAALQNPPDEFVREHAEDLLNQTRDQADQAGINETLVEELVEETVGTAINTSLEATEYENETRLRAVLQANEAAIESLTKTVEALNTTVNTVATGAGNGTVDATMPYGSDFDEDGVTVIAHYPNGSTIPVDGEYWNVDKQVGQGDQVVINNYPLGNTSPRAVELESRVVDENGEVGASSVVAENPTTSAELPAIDSISFSTLRPGPSDQVEVTVHPADDSTFDAVENATVWKADTAVATPTVTGGDSFTFQTSGEGRHLVELEISTTDSDDDVTETIPIDVGAEDLPMPAEIRMQSSPALGEYALTGDGIDEARVEQSAGGSHLAVDVLVDPEDVPNRIRVHTDELTGTEQRVQLALLDAADESQLDRSIPVTIRLPSLQDDAHVRVDDHPVPADGNQYGARTTLGGSAAIKTYTTGGQVVVTADNAPSLTEQLDWWLDRGRDSLGGYLPSLLAVPDAALLPDLGPLSLFGGLVGGEPA